MAQLRSTTVNSTDLLRLPLGTTAQRPVTPAVGMVRFNTDLGYAEIYNGASWGQVFQRTNKFNKAFGGVKNNNGAYTVHSFIEKEIYRSVGESTATHNDANWRTLKSFSVAETGVISIRFSAYIQSGTFYWAYRIRKNATTDLATGGYSSGPFYAGDSAAVHNYRNYIVEGMSVNAGDNITVEMISATGSEVPTTGNGQILYMKEMSVNIYGYTFVPTMTGNVEVLVVAGGGGSGRHSGGGGGAGGVVYYSDFPVTADTSYTVTVGRGGETGGPRAYESYPTTDGGTGRQGKNSVFGSITAIGGGGGGFYGSNGTTGGSGGGSSRNRGAGSAGTAGQGFAGGSSSIGSVGEPNYPAAGGGGAGGPGTSPTSTLGGNGGPGLVFSISGKPTWYGGGGGGNIQYSSNYGGNGGSGGGGAGSWGEDRGGHYGFDGAINTGGGGGGTHYNALADIPPNQQSRYGRGGSGIVLVRYRDTSPAEISQTFINVGGSNWIAPTGVTKVDALVVAGGGGGGNGTGSNWGSGGGGGGGGLVYYTGCPVTSESTYLVTVGAGGAGAAQGANSNGSAGGNSNFSAITSSPAVGGGAGASANLTAGSGGSGGGQGYFSGGAGAGTNGQGYTGATNAGTTSSSGGGGGAAGPGITGGPSKRGIGGPGRVIEVSGTLEYYAGGGGGGFYNSMTVTGGTGGPRSGGNGGQSSTSFSYAGEPGVPGTGGGGGGGSGAAGLGSAAAGKGGDGGSGVVIVKWIV